MAEMATLWWSKLVVFTSMTRCQIHHITLANRQSRGAHVCHYYLSGTTTAGECGRWHLLARECLSVTLSDDYSQTTGGLGPNCPPDWDPTAYRWQVGPHDGSSFGPFRLGVNCPPPSPRRRFPFWPKRAFYNQYQRQMVKVKVKTISRV